MKALLACTVLLLSTVPATAALAQVADPQIGTAAETRKPRKREPSDSFESLPRILKVGQEVKVRDEAGRTTRGKVVSISDNQLVVASQRFFKARAKQAFDKEAIRSIKIVDSHWNGALIGVTASIGIAAVVLRACTGECQGSTAYGGIASGLAPLIGWGIDDAINATIYERPSQTPQITLLPMLGRERIGLMARVQF